MQVHPSLLRAILRPCPNALSQARKQISLYTQSPPHATPAPSGALVTEQQRLVQRIDGNCSSHAAKPKSYGGKFAMHSQQWRRPLKPRCKMAAGCCAVLALAVAACSSGGGSGSPGASPTGATGAKVIGGTATWALPPNSAPNYIFPFASSTYFSTVNFAEFQYLMYRPLYWFGTGP